MKWLRKHKIVVSFLLLLLLLTAMAAGYIWSKLQLIDYDDGTLKQEETGLPEQLPEEEQLVDISGLQMVQTPPEIPNQKLLKRSDVVNILLLGTDDYGGRLTEEARSDCMILVSIDKRGKTVKLVSLERGMGVPILEGEYQGAYDWLTHIFRYGGSDLVCRTVEHCFGVEIDHYVRVTFHTVTAVVDAIGGVSVDMSEIEASCVRNYYIREGKYQYAAMDAGVNLLDGDGALFFARLRSIDSDWQRVERQRKVILAAVDALKGAGLKQLDDLLDETLPLIQTDMTMLQIAEMMLYAPSFLTSEFDQTTIPKAGTYGGMTGLGGRGLFAVDFEVNSRILREFLYGEAE